MRRSLPSDFARLDANISSTRARSANSVPLFGTGRGELNDATQAASPFCCLIKASARFANS
jgi:hypothetical protein